MKWWRYSKDIEKELIIVLTQGLFFVAFYVIFAYLSQFSSFLSLPLLLGIVAFQGICLFFSIYFLIFSILITKKWIDITYKDRK